MHLNPKASDRKGAHQHTLLPAAKRGSRLRWREVARLGPDLEAGHFMERLVQLVFGSPTVLPEGAECTRKCKNEGAP